MDTYRTYYNTEITIGTNNKTIAYKADEALNQTTVNCNKIPISLRNI